MKPGDRRGAMCEWALALGWSLRTTQQYSGAGDGRPRDGSSPAPEPPSAAEIVDLSAAVRASADANDPAEAAAGAVAILAAPPAAAKTAAPCGGRREQSHAGYGIPSRLVTPDPPAPPPDRPPGMAHPPANAG